MPESKYPSEEAVREAADDLMREACAPDGPGAAVLVARNGTPIVRKGYGLASLELGVPVEPHMVFRIGSLTKQFTAVAVLILAERGELSLEDDVTRYLPKYPTGGRRITVEHLLTHSGGIRNYTDMPEWLQLWRRDMTVQELVDFFRNQPLEFAPGEHWEYSNSGYILLGAIIERISGRTYAEFLEENIFGPLGMRHTCYDQASRVIPGRVPGYDRIGDEWQNAPYISMTQPFSAGALASSVDDLLLWDEALYTDRLLSPELLGRAFTPARLRDGTPTGYGYGWVISEYAGRRTAEHGGGINGFLSYAIRVPEEHLYVAVLMNTTAPGLPPEQVAVRLAGIAMGRPYAEPEPAEVSRAELERLVGVYRVSDRREQVVTLDGDRLRIQGTSGRKEDLLPLSPREFVVRGSFTRVRFDPEAGELELRARFGPPERGVRVETATPEERQTVHLEPTQYEEYAGRYELAPGLVVDVQREDDHLLVQGPGLQSVAMYPDSETSFFVKDYDVRVDFVRDGPTGAVSGVVIHHAGNDYSAPRVDRGG